MTFVIDEHHWLSNARRCLSPNQDARTSSLPSVLVMHAISLPPGQFEGDHVERLFTNTLPIGAHSSYASLKGVRVSSHLFIRRDGEIIQFVPFDRRAWHAGRSYWHGICGLNDAAIGIELEGDSAQRYTHAQYKQLSKVGRALMARYPDLTPSRMVGHALIAPYRKEDPGPGFDWQLFFASLQY